MKTGIYQLLCLAVILISCKNNQGPKTTETLLQKAISNIPQATTGYQHQAMILGTFHFNRNTDGSDVVAKNHLDITSDTNQVQIENLVNKLAEQYKPTIIAVEWMPSFQPKFDSLYQEYKKGNWELPKNEAFQIGFRLANKLNLPTIHCVDNRPPSPESVNEIDDWDQYAQSLNQETLWHEYDEDNQRFNQYMDEMLLELGLIDYLKLGNSPAHLKRYKELSFTGLVNLGYEDSYIGADFTGNWYRRNTRIFVNTRNLCQEKAERVLVIYGAGHKWALDEIFDGSPEFTLIQPFEY